MKKYEYMDAKDNDNYENLLNILKQNEAIFMDEIYSKAFQDVTKRLTGRKDIHIADEKRYLFSIGFMTRKGLDRNLYEMLEKMYD